MHQRSNLDINISYTWTTYENFARSNILHCQSESIYQPHPLKFFYFICTFENNCTCTLSYSPWKLNTATDRSKWKYCITYTNLINYSPRFQQLWIHFVYTHCFSTKKWILRWCIIFRAVSVQTSTPTWLTQITRTYASITKLSPTALFVTIANIITRIIQ